MKVPAPSLAPILRSDVQGRLLARLFADPATAYSLSDLVEWAGSSMPRGARSSAQARRQIRAGPEDAAPGLPTPPR